MLYCIHAIQEMQRRRTVEAVRKEDDGRAAFQFDQLKFNWFEVNASDLFVSHNY